MDAEREKTFDELVDRTRTAFADVSEEQLMQDVLAIIEQNRQEQRNMGWCGDLAPSSARGGHGIKASAS